MTNDIHFVKLELNGMYRPPGKQILSALKTREFTPFCINFQKIYMIDVV